MIALAILSSTGQISGGYGLFLDILTGWG